MADFLSLGAAGEIGWLAEFWPYVVCGWIPSKLNGWVRGERVVWGYRPLGGRGTCRGLGGPSRVI